MVSPQAAFGALLTVQLHFVLLVYTVRGLYAGDSCDLFHIGDYLSEAGILRWADIRSGLLRQIRRQESDVQRTVVFPGTLEYHGQIAVHRETARGGLKTGADGAISRWLLEVFISCPLAF